MKHKFLILSALALTLALALTGAILMRSDVGLTSAADIPEGAIMVQLGAYPSMTEAKTAWKALVTNPSISRTSAKMVLMKAHSAGRDFYRLRLLGFSDRDDARNLCHDLVDQIISCIPVVNRK